MSFWVYVHINKVNGKKYVGTTQAKKPQYRWGKSGRGYLKHTGFYNAINKYGWKNFDHCYIECRSIEEMYSLEIQYIKKYQTNNPKYGYNRSHGGEISSDQGKNSYSREYRVKHDKEYNQRYYISHKNQIKEHNRQYYLDHRDYFFKRRRMPAQQK